MLIIIGWKQNVRRSHLAVAIETIQEKESERAKHVKGCGERSYVHRKFDTTFLNLMAQPSRSPILPWPAPAQLRLHYSHACRHAAMIDFHYR